MIRKLASLLFVLSILVVTCCGSNIVETDEENSCDLNSQACHNVINFTLLADSNLKEDTKIAIMDALAEWDIRTGERIGYLVIFKDMSKESTDNSTYKNTYKLLIQDPGPGLLGYTTWRAARNSALILMKPSMGRELFRQVLLHELGHAFDLHFDKETHYIGTQKSIMHPAIGNTDRLECPELLAFCGKYKCQVDCDYAPANPLYLQSNKPSENSCQTTAADLTSQEP